MIDIKKLTNRDMGREVVLVLLDGDRYEGKIVNWDDCWIYVKYSKLYSDWDAVKNNKRGLQTHSSDLEFNGPPKPIITRADLMDFD